MSGHRVIAVRRDEHGRNAVHGDVTAHTPFESAETSDLSRDSAGGSDDGLNGQPVIDTGHFTRCENVGFDL